MTRAFAFQGRRESSALGMSRGEGDGEQLGSDFVSEMGAFSSGSTEASSRRSSMSRPGPAAGVPSLETPLSPFRIQRPYSLISTDGEGNDTPILFLRQLVIDTNEDPEQDEERQSRLFFRPPRRGGIRTNSYGSSSSTQESEMSDSESGTITPESIATPPAQTRQASMSENALGIVSGKEETMLYESVRRLRTSISAQNAAEEQQGK
jgi:hypothetical protein